MGDRPLHSVAIRHRSKGFRWLEALDDTERQKFYESINKLIADLPILIHGCVIDRPGYNARYRPQYGTRRWNLCKTAFALVVERAAKHAIQQGARLRVYVERSDKKTDRCMENYYSELRKNGLPFQADTSAKYDPLSAVALSACLMEFGTKTKASRLMQIADLCLWPVCVAGYETDRKNPAYRSLAHCGKLVDHLYPDKPEMRIKYSCFA